MNYFLRDEQGKRYPPKPEIAKKLLKQKHSVWLMKRSVNFYWYEQEAMLKRQIEPQESFDHFERTWGKPDYLLLSHEVVVPTRSLPIQSNIPFNELVSFPKNTPKPELLNEQTTPLKRSVRFYKKPLPDDTDEWLAQKVYLTIGNLQEVEPRQLVDKYGRKAVGQALGRMEFMREKGELQNPAGFIKVVSRVCWLAINGFDTTRPEYQSPKKRKPRKTAYNPMRDPIWQSESYCEWRLSFEDAPIDMWEMPLPSSRINF